MLIEGLGYEGILTVYDETPRMYRRLGTPRTDPKRPLWYFYDSGPFRLVVRAEYRDSRFFVASIQAAGGERGRIVTNSGVRSGDPLRKVIDTHGEPERIEGQDYVYESRGVTYNVGKDSTIVGIVVYRPKGPGAKTVPPPATPVDEKEGPSTLAELFKPAAPSTPQPADLGVEIPLSDRFKPFGEATAAGAAWTARGVTVRASVCTDCALELAVTVRSYEAALPENRIPPALRAGDDADRTRTGAELTYFGFYPGPAGEDPVWLVAIRKGLRSVMITISVRTAEVDTATLQDVATLLQGIKFR